jgi:hypothetical protein
MKRLSEFLLIRWASSQTSTSRPLRRASTKKLKHLKISLIREEPRPAYLRIDSVKEFDPVACSTGYPCLANSARTDNAITLLPLPGPPATTTTLLMSCSRAC